MLSNSARVLKQYLINLSTHKLKFLLSFFILCVDDEQLYSESFYVMNWNGRCLYDSLI
jgi:hypothetical protein